MQLTRVQNHGNRAKYAVSGHEKVDEPLEYMPPEQNPCLSGQVHIPMWLWQ